jgi:hypothetical protein
MTSTKNSSHDIFWLARYAHNKTAPLIEQAKAIEPSIMFSIHITFADEGTVYDGNNIGIYSHWDRDGMFQYSTWLRTKADVDRFVAKVEGDVANLQPLDVTA